MPALFLITSTKFVYDILKSDKYTVEQNGEQKEKTWSAVYPTQ